MGRTDAGACNPRGTAEGGPGQREGEEGKGGRIVIENDVWGGARRRDRDGPGIEPYLAPRIDRPRVRCCAMLLAQQRSTSGRGRQKKSSRCIFAPAPWRAFSELCEAPRVIITSGVSHTPSNDREAKTKVRTVLTLSGESERVTGVPKCRKRAMSRKTGVGFFPSPRHRIPPLRASPRHWRRN